MTVQRAAFAKAIAPVLIGAGASVLMARTLPVSPFFLVPLGVAALLGSRRTGFAVAALAVLFNFAAVVLSAGAAVFAEPFALASDTAYFAVLVVSFSWAAGRDDEAGRPRRLGGGARLIASSVLSTVVLFGVLLAARRNEAVVEFFKVQAAAVADAFKAAAGADVVQKSLLERELTAEAVVKTFSDIVVRGALVGHVIFFGVSLRIARMVAAFRRPSLRSIGGFLLYRNAPYLVWLLIASLLGVVGAERLGGEAAIALSWNVMLLCVLLYAAQGAAVVMYNLSRPGIPALVRSMIVFAAVLIVFRPGINAAVAVALAVVGVAENWLPLRAPINTEPPSTPEA